MFLKKIFVKDLHALKESDGKVAIQSVFLVKFAAVVTDKNGRPFMNLVLMDKTGEIESRIWDDCAKYSGQIVRDALIGVEGKCQVYQGRKQLVISKAQLLREDEVELKDYLVESLLDANFLYEKLLGYVASMADPYYRALAESILRDDAEIVAKYKKAPAAKSVHHAYPVGLLEHVVSITETLDHFSKLYSPYVDRDLLFLGGFLHDIGKLWELSYEKVTDYTIEGKLIGHLVMGVELVEKKVRELEAQQGRLPEGVFPEEKKLLVKHVILAHHGELEYGSPKRPKCLEALIVHYVDDLDSKVNSIRNFIQMDQSPGKFTGLNRMYERYFFKPEWAQKAQA